MIKRKT
jgi:hypothetical protein